MDDVTQEELDRWDYLNEIWVSTERLKKWRERFEYLEKRIKDMEASMALEPIVLDLIGGENCKINLSKKEVNTRSG